MCFIQPYNPIYSIRVAGISRTSDQQVRSFSFQYNNLVGASNDTSQVCTSVLKQTQKMCHLHQIFQNKPVAVVVLGLWLIKNSFMYIVLKTVQPLLQSRFSPKFSISLKAKSFGAFKPSIIVFCVLRFIRQSSRIKPTSTPSLHTKTQTTKSSRKVDSVLITFPVNQPFESAPGYRCPPSLLNYLPNIDHNHGPTYVTMSKISISHTYRRIGSTE